MKHGAHIFDWHRVFFGNVPPVFLLEVVFRALAMYVALLLTLRFLGKRMNAQLSIIDLAVMISLGAIISLPMESPKQGLMPGFVLLFLILIFQRGLGYLSFKSPKIGQLVYGRESTLVKNGIMQRPIMESEDITKNELFAQLRKSNVTQLGEVARVYLEQNGMFSVFPAPKPKPGLSTLPEVDDPDLASQKHESDQLVCCVCGALAEEGAPDTDECATCHHHRWKQAVT